MTWMWSTVAPRSSSAISLTVYRQYRHPSQARWGAGAAAEVEARPLPPPAARPSSASSTCAQGGLARELASQTSDPASQAAKAREPVTPEETQPTGVSRMPCTNIATSRPPRRGRRVTARTYPSEVVTVCSSAG